MEDRMLLFLPPAHPPVSAHSVYKQRRRRPRAREHLRGVRSSSPSSLPPMAAAGATASDHAGGGGGLLSAGGYTALETDDIKMLPITRVSAIHNDVHEILLRNGEKAKGGRARKRREPGAGLNVGTHKELFYEGPNTFNNLCKATRGIIPRMKWRTQEKGSVLGDVMETRRSKMSGKAPPQRPRHHVGAPWPAAMGVDASRIQYGAITDMDAHIRGDRSTAIGGAVMMQQARQRRASSIVDMNSQASSSMSTGGGGDTTGGGGGDNVSVDRRSGVSDGGSSSSSAGNVLEKMKKDVGQLRGYLQLLDQYSLHHFIIFKGRAVTDTPEFESFRRLYAAWWGPIISTINALERLLKKHNVPLAVIDGPKVSELAVLECLRPEELLSCIANLDQIQPLLAVKTYATDRRLKRRGRLATQIQAIVRGYLCRQTLRRLKEDRKASMTLQTACRAFVSVRRMRARLKSNKQAEAEAWEALQVKLTDKWASLSSGEEEHFIIHLPSLSIEEHLRLGMAPGGLAQRQNAQLMRIYDGVTMANASIIYISPCQLPEEVVGYHRQLFERLGVPSRRLHILVPENAERFPRHMSLASLLYYSPCCIRRVRSLIKGKPAYIVPSVPHWQDKKLAHLLSAPLLSVDPSILQEYTAKSGVKRAFAQANVNIPLGAHDIYTEETLLLSLTKLIAGNLAIDRWLVKIDVDYESMSWAYVDVGGMEAVAALRKEKAKLEEINASNPHVWHHHDVQLIARSKIIREMRPFLERHLVICSPDIYPSFATYLGYIGRYGAVIEAEPKHIRGYPAVSLFIDPLGDVSVRATYDLIADTATYRRLASVCPASCVPRKALEGAALSIGRKLFDRKVIGHVGLRFLVFQDMRKQQLRMWALEATIGLSDYAACHNVFQLIRTSMSGREQARRAVVAAGSSNMMLTGRTGGGGAIAGGYYEEEGAAVTGAGGLTDPPGVSLATTTNEAAAAGAGGATSSSSLILKPLPTATHYTVVENVMHPSFTNITLPAFFKACRLERISYNMDSHRGLAFLFTDRFSSNGVGLMGLGGSAYDSMVHVINGLDFLKRQLGGRALNGSEEGREFLKVLWALGHYRDRALKKAAATAAAAAKK